MQRPLTLIGGFVILGAVGIVACSSADEPEGDAGGGTSGSGGATTGGSTTGGTATGGASGTATGGSTTGGTATGGSGGSGTATGGSGGGVPPECKGISRDTPCAMEGLNCPNLPCGLADSGTRECNCATNWMCTSCNFTGAWTETKPADVMPCPDGIADEVTCTTDHLICGPQASGEYCACWMSPSDGQSWDCDDPPSTWPP